MYMSGKSVCHSCCNVGDMVIKVSHFCPKVAARYQVAVKGLSL